MTPDPQLTGLVGPLVHGGGHGIHGQKGGNEATGMIGDLLPYDEGRQWTIGLVSCTSVD